MEVPQGFFVLLVALLTSPEDTVVSASSAVLITSENRIVQLGSSLTLNCTTSCSPGKPRWDKMTDSHKVEKDDHDQYSTLTIPDITVDDTTFSCKATCGQKPKRSAVELYYFSALNITADPKEPVSGQQFLLKCRVDIHRDMTAKLKLKHKETVMVTQAMCKDSEDYQHKHCEISWLTEATGLPYQCEAALQVESSHLTKTAELHLPLREAMSTKPPIKPTSPPAEAPSTAALNVPAQTERPRPLSTTAFKAMSTKPPIKPTSPPAEAPSTAALNVPAQTERPRPRSTAAFKAQGSKSGQTVTVSVPVVLVIVIILAGLFCFLRKRKCQEKPKGEVPPP
ncbi:uncharacterized protein LOC108413746 isoform X3 [Pygocentrus nattereri]|uniref:uncharacterized protein LOC108413746 isoform X3 n=1 Tax=Pygocentrus nattereri TaxID=42514 RepID=UPI001891AC2D|nr:uncharacterized protein LOC108413746 isoform X3 [Pygocentrus nattereri]